MISPFLLGAGIVQEEFHGRAFAQRGGRFELQDYGEGRMGHLP